MLQGFAEVLRRDILALAPLAFQQAMFVSKHPIDVLGSPQIPAHLPVEPQRGAHPRNCPGSHSSVCGNARLHQG